MPNPEDLKRPAYRSLAEAVLRAVEAGALKAGDRLPTHRDLAYRLGISVQTVSRAYEDLIARGIITGEVGRGTFVRATQGDAKPPFLPDSQYDRLVDCSILKPVCDQIHVDQMRAALSRLGEEMPASAVLSFRPSVALRNSQSSALKWLRLCGLAARTDSVLLTNGSTSAMTIALMAAASPGDLVVTEEVGHHTLKPLCRYLGLRLKGLRIDAEGIVPADFDAVCRTNAVRALFLMPAGLNPTTAVMGLARRREICAIAERHDVLMIENDAWGPVQPDRPDPIAALAPDRTFYFTGFSKCIMPGLRTGYLVAPERFEAAVANRHLVTNWMATPILAEITSRWIEDGTAARLLDWQIDALSRRNRLAAEVLSGIDFRASPNGLHVWLPLPEPWTEEEFVAHARLNGVAVAPGSSFTLGDRPNPPAVRICIGAATEEALGRGLATVARLARSHPEPALLTI
ncbi:MAG: PLP-dependent aminotransferase family protein [Albidovulum sp.]|uniref:MocR-like ectoine utilization transcription factor EhuR n=1 Tax=Albidovulum sp. TaxID=1872424 RepID=UPI003CB2E310